MRSWAIPTTEIRSLRKWMAASALAAVLAGCSASQPPTCRPDDDPNRSVGAVAGRVLLGIAEVVVGADLVDHDAAARRVACARDDRSSRPGTPDAAANAVPSTPVASEQSERTPPTTQASRASQRQASPSAASKSETVYVRPGRWILVKKLDRTLSVYEDDHRLKTYPIVLGDAPMRPKLYEGDGRTPEGEYHIVSKHDHAAWQRFLLLDYPNEENREAYTRNRARGLVPARGGQVPGAGGAIGIHGTKDDDLNQNGVNWTRGCISLLSRDIRELYDTVPVGTPVIIQR